MTHEQALDGQGTIDSEVQGSCLRITLQRARRHNALSLTLIDELLEALREAARMTQIRSVVIAGEGRSFCAGMDLVAAGENPDGMAKMLHNLALVMSAIRALPVPVIARVQGAAIGGGCGLMTVSDIVVSHPEAKLGYPEVDFGICPAVVAPCLANRIGAGRARALLLSGGLTNGQRGHEIGLVNTLVEADRLDETVEGLVERFQRGGRAALTATKQWINTLENPNLDDQFLEGAALSAKILSGEEAQERLARLRG